MESSKIIKRQQSNRQLDKARNVVVYIKNPLMYIRSEYERWILNHMFTSINVEDLKVIFFLSLYFLFITMYQ